MIDKEKILKYIAIGLIPILLITSVIAYVKLRNKESEIVILHNQLADASGLQQINETLFSDVAYLKERINTKNSEVEALSNKVVYYTNLSMQKDTIIIEQEVPVPIESSMGAKMYPIVWEGQGIYLNGNFTLPESIFRANVTFDPITVKIWATEDKNGVWSTMVESSNLMITDIYSEVVPYGEKVLPKYWFSFGTYGGKVPDGYTLGMVMGIGIRSWGLNAGLDFHGWKVGITRIWSF